MNSEEILKEITAKTVLEVMEREHERNQGNALMKMLKRNSDREVIEECYTDEPGRTR